MWDPVVHFILFLLTDETKNIVIYYFSFIILYFIAKLNIIDVWFLHFWKFSKISCSPCESFQSLGFFFFIFISLLSLQIIQSWVFLKNFPRILFYQCMIFVYWMYRQYRKVPWAKLLTLFGSYFFFRTYLPL